jgi:hypothetical protein
MCGKTLGVHCKSRWVWRNSATKMSIRKRQNKRGWLHVCDGLMYISLVALHFSLSSTWEVYTARLTERLSCNNCTCLARLPERFIVCKDIEPFTFRFERLQILKILSFVSVISSSGPWDLFHLPKAAFSSILDARTINRIFLFPHVTPFWTNASSLWFRVF